MKKLYWIFLQLIIKQALLILMLTVPTVTVLHKSGLEVVRPAIIICWVVFFSAPFLLLFKRGVGSNLGWLLNLPLKKGDLIRLHYLLGWSSYVIFFLAGCLFTYYAQCNLNLNLYGWLFHSGRAPSSVPVLLELNLNPSPIQAYAGMWMAFFGFFSILHSFSLALLPDQVRAQSQSFNFKKQWRALSFFEKLGFGLISFVSVPVLLGMSRSIQVPIYFLFSF